MIILDIKQKVTNVEVTYDTKRMELHVSRTTETDVKLENISADRLKELKRRVKIGVPDFPVDEIASAFLIGGVAYMVDVPGNLYKVAVFEEGVDLVKWEDMWNDLENYVTSEQDVC
jgi:hypothetical protein